MKKLCFIGSGVEDESTRVDGIEVHAVVQALRPHFDVVAFGGTGLGLMSAFVSAFQASGGRVVSIVPRWLERHNIVFQGVDAVYCEDLAERKRLLFSEADAVMCYPGGIGTWDELFDLLARRAMEPGAICPPVYLYNWEQYYAPLILQVETALEAGLIHPHTVAMIKPFASVQELISLMEA